MKPPVLCIRRRWIVTAVIAMSLVAACGGKGSGGDAERIAECDAYAAKVRTCFGMDANAPVLAAAAPSASITDPARRAELRERCTQGIARLNASCR